MALPQLKLYMLNKTNYNLIDISCIKEILSSYPNEFNIFCEKNQLKPPNILSGRGKDKVPANIMTTEEYNDTYDKNFLVPKPTKAEKGLENTHITVKPLALIEHLVKLFSKENSLVFDPFLGSGTTALACKNTNRRCIGTEINKEYYDICCKRCL